MRDTFFTLCANLISKVLILLEADFQFMSDLTFVVRFASKHDKPRNATLTQSSIFHLFLIKSTQNFRVYRV
jgi:hypothetical protein